MSTEIQVRRVNWLEAENELRYVRQQVFIVEQGIPPELEWDDQDAVCQHFLAMTSTNQITGTARLGADGKVERMAVLASWRGHHVGDTLLSAIEDYAREQGLTRLYLHAQSRALGFYQQNGFVVDSEEEFDEAGIPHRYMSKDLAAHAH